MDRRSRLHVEPLEAREVPSVVRASSFEAPSAEFGQVTAHGLVGQPLLAEPRVRLAIGSGVGAPGRVEVYAGTESTPRQTLTPFGEQFTGGIRVATGDLTGDGVEDVVAAAGPGAGPWVRVYDGATGTEIRRFAAYAESFTGGVYVATGDVTGDSQADLITGAGAGGGPHVRVFDGRELRDGATREPRAHLDFFPYSPSFSGGVSVAVGDVDADGVGDIITGAGPGGGPHVVAFRATDQAVLASFFAYTPEMKLGVLVAAADLDGDARAEIITGPQAGGGPHVQVFDGNKVEANLCPFAGDLRCGATVTAKDRDGDGQFALIVATGPGTRPQIREIDSFTGQPLRELTPLAPEFLGGLFVG